MKDLQLKVAAKFGLILAGISLLFGVINTLTYNPNSSYQLSVVVTAVLTWLALIVVIAMAHYEFNQKNGNYISFNDAIIIGLVILGIACVLSTVYAVINYELMLKEDIQKVYSNYTDQHGLQKFDNPFSAWRIVQSSILGLIMQVFVLFLIITLEAQWKIYRKAGYEGWFAIVPIYNTIVLLEIVKKPTWWIILLLIPFLNIIFFIWVTNLLAKRFYKEEGFTVGLLLLPFIFYPLLGLSDATYNDEDF